MNTIELLATIRNCFEEQNPNVLIPKNFSKKKKLVLNAALKDVVVNKSSETLVNLTKVWVRILSSGDDKAYDKCISALSKNQYIPNSLRRRLQKNIGEGQLRFVAQSPAGPARLCRVPFYPVRNENAWSTRYLSIDTSSPSRQPFGIDTLGDDPIVSIGPWLGNQNSTKLSSIQMKTQKVEFGSYRLIGMEINAYYGSRYIGAVTTTGVAATGTITNQNIAAVAATADFTITGDGGGGGFAIGTTQVRVVSTTGADETFTSVAPPANGANEFINFAATNADIATNLASKINAKAGFSAASVGDTCTVTQQEIGTVGNGQIATSDQPARVTNPATFTGGVDNITDGLLIGLEDADGTTATFEFDFAGGGVAPGNIAVPIDNITPANSMRNLSEQINAFGGLDITATHADGSLVVNVTQDATGVAGNTLITSSIAAEVAPVGFAGGAAAGGGLSLNLTNPLSPVAITVKEVTVYNGNNILIVEDSESVSVSEFNILNKTKELAFVYTFDGANLNPEGQTSQPLSHDSENSRYKFIGFRDQPIVDPNSQVFLKVDAFIANLPVYNGGYPANTPLPKIPPVSLSINLVVDLLEDKVFGDIAAPSPASRAAANVKLSAREVGKNKIIIDNSTTKISKYKKPRI